MLFVGSVVLCLSFLGQTFALARSPESEIKIFQEKVGKKKDEAVFKISLDDIKGNIVAEDIRISFNPDDYVFDSYSSLDQGIPVIASKTSEGSVRLILTSLGMEHAIHGDKDLLEVRFKAKKTKAKDLSVQATIADEFGNELILSSK
ncbi:cohesin domain-containing protein [Bacillus sp. 3255]|uniref:cohesin domain-containing protein n=1 Tax=Bacillus sp. 3255 TaxID=2817904 RepID=UPI00286BF803|nr:cohesin domain-containing protein [Bacillus sp. 3255]